MNGYPDTQASQAAVSNQFASETPSAGLPWRLLMFSIVFFGFFIFVYIGIKFGYESYLTSQKNAVASSTATLAREINADDQNQFVNFYSQIFNLKKVFANHSFTSNIFKFLENNVAAGVYFTNATYSAASGKVDISGVATSNATLVQQLAAFDASPDVSEAILTQMNYDEKGQVTFGVKVTFGNSFFKQSL